MNYKKNYETPALEEFNVDVESGFAASTELQGLDAPDMENGGGF